jgi:hypothetical protein
MSEPSLILPGVAQNASQIDGPLPSPGALPSICAALVAAPNWNSGGSDGKGNLEEIMRVGESAI